MTGVKALLLAAGAAMLLLLGVGVAYATGSGGDSSGRATETNLNWSRSPLSSASLAIPARHGYELYTLQLVFSQEPG